MKRLANVVRKVLVPTVFALVVLLAAFGASAQRSGGRFGGSRSFGSGSSGSSYRSSGSSYGSGRSYGSGSSYGSRSYSYPSSGYNTYPSSGRYSGRPISGGVACGVLALFLGVIVVIAIFRARSGVDTTPRVATMDVFQTQGSSCEVRRVSVAFDWTARAQLQQALDQAAASFDMNSPQGLWSGANAARDLLHRWLSAARYASFQSIQVPQMQADARFGQVIADLNRRYGQATIDNARRVILENTGAPRVEEGQGLVVVSIVVGVRDALPRLPQWPSRDAVAQVLGTLVPVASRLVALEVVWSPSVDADRLSSAELEVLYPELVRLDGDTGVGRVVCEHCRCVYARELGRCPACGSNASTNAPTNQPAGAQVATAGTTMSCKWCHKPMPAYEVQCQNCGGRADA